MQRRIELERPAIRSRLTVSAVGKLYLEHLEHLENVLERKPSTIGGYRSMLGRHIEPFFGDRPLERINPEEIRRFLAMKKRDGLTTKTITNCLVFMHGLFAFAVKREWMLVNPIAAVDRPRAPHADPDIRYLNLEEVESLLRAVADDYLGPTEHAVYLTAAMSGLRQGELIALRWMDIYWQARRIRVRRTYTRHQFGTPKSRRSSHSVPMTDRVAGELERHFQASEFQADHDLVFAHPYTGHPLDDSKLRKRFKEALARAGLRTIRFPRSASHLRHPLRLACHCGRSKSGSATATSRQL